MSEADPGEKNEAPLPPPDEPPTPAPAATVGAAATASAPSATEGAATSAPASAAIEEAAPTTPAPVVTGGTATPAPSTEGEAPSTENPAATAADGELGPATNGETTSTSNPAAAEGAAELVPKTSAANEDPQNDEARSESPQPKQEQASPGAAEEILADKETDLTIIVGTKPPFPPEEETLAVVTIKPPKGATRQPSDLVCVIDVSGSMSGEATIQSAGGTTESHGLSLLDVAKHGVRTILKTLNQHDRLAIVSFNHGSIVECKLTVMDAEGQAAAETALDRLEAMGGTNIWEGLHNSLEQLRENRGSGRFGHIMLLTDGESTNRDSIVPNLEKYKAQYEKLPGTISTFGFGYRLDSNLLVNLADAGSGSYSFIPDAGFVGTAFVNTMSNLLVTMGCEAMLILSADNGSEILKETGNTLSGGFPLIPSGPDSIVVNVGTLQYGQSKDIVVPMKIKNATDSFLVAKLQYTTRHGEVVEPGLVEGTANTPFEAHAVAEQNCRRLFANTLKAAVGLAKQEKYEGDDGAKASLEQLIKQVTESPACETTKIKALLEDMQGQSSEALSKREYFTKWGMHYLPSLMFAHRLQQCNNFKDPGVQVYGGDLFADTRDVADDVFNELPAPKPSRPPRASVSYSAPVSMSAYNDRYSG